MINSIQHFHEFGVKDLEKVMMTDSADMTKIAEMVYGVAESVVNLLLQKNWKCMMNTCEKVTRENKNGTS